MAGVLGLVLIGFTWFFAPGILVHLMDANLWLIKEVCYLLPFGTSIESALRFGLAADKMLLVLEAGFVVRLAFFILLEI